MYINISLWPKKNQVPNMKIIGRHQLVLMSCHFKFEKKITQQQKLNILLKSLISDEELKSLKIKSNLKFK